ncbi:hypothetical protein CYL18_08655 [Pradoshia eiseniae]|uniref:Phospholipid phosphatase n=1 Tax=Pradoshia eiseniae TaxID=2064768 RepID=A0A2S7N020_9BACI|nr:hypothetical protein [Pradoshia eiseniae]PQD95350.1 hypothetical protein CYL18_08655 [Pradoshia eiseniae]
MDIWLYLMYALAYLALFIIMVRSMKRNGIASLSNVLILVILPLIYDNTILGVGSWIGEGQTLEVLNTARYWMHAIFTPLLIVFSLGILRRARVNWANTSAALWITVVYAFAAFMVELVTVLLNLSLEAEVKYGVLSYASTNSPSGPPIMILMVTLALLVSSIILWKRTGWFWMFIGVALMLVGSMVDIPVESAAITNAFELILLTSLVMTKLHQDRN